MIEDVVVALEDAVREPVVSHELPDVLDGIEFGRAGRERHEGDIGGDFKGQGGVPSGPVEHDDGMGAGFDSAADLGEMGVQRLCIGVGHDEAGGLALVRADGAEDIGGGRPLILGRRRSSAAFCPSPGDLVLLPDASLVLPPDFDLDPVAERGAYLPQAVREVFLNAARAALSWA